MNRALIWKCIHEAKYLLMACGAAIFAFCWMRVWLVSRIETERFQAILELVPDELQRFSPVDFAWIVTYAGRISLTYDEPIVVFGVSIWAISRGSDCVSGEASRGTMEMLLAQPISRLQVFLTQTAVTVSGVFLLAFISLAGVWCGIMTCSVTDYVSPTLWFPVVGDVPLPFLPAEEVVSPMREKVDATYFIPAALNLCFLGFMLAGVTAFFSSWDRYRWRTIGLAVGFYVVSLIIKIVGLGVDYCEWMAFFSVFTAYEPEALVQIAHLTPEYNWSIWFYDAKQQFNFGPWGFHLPLIGVGLASYTVAAIIFHRRDIPAPL